MNTKIGNELDAILMVGGEGNRLAPLTLTTPKPMLDLGGKPILEHTLERLIACGFRRFCFAVHYKASQIQNYFQDGRKWNVSIEYLHEKEKMGTAGSLFHLQDRVQKPILVMNGDLLTDVDFAAVVKHHLQCQAVATMCVVPYELKVPYGMVELAGTSIKAIKEKPTFCGFANAGIYVLSQQAVQSIPENSYFNMPDLFEQLIAAGKTVSAYSIQGAWSDIGDLDELARARMFYSGRSDSVAVINNKIFTAPA